MMRLDKAITISVMVNNASNLGNFSRVITGPYGKRTATWVKKMTRI